MNEELKDRLKKIQTLAERGVGGEKETAQKKLEKLLAENGMTEADLNKDETHYYLFSYSGGPYCARLLRQIMYKVLGEQSHFAMYRSKGTRNKYGIYCTPAQKLEIDLDYEFYRNIFETELDLFLTAFIQKQGIFPEDVPHEYIELDELTPEEKEKFIKQRAYAGTISKRQRAAGMIEDSTN